MQSAHDRQPIPRRFFRGVIAAASLKHVNREEYTLGHVRFFRGVIAAASLKHAMTDVGNARRFRLPRRHRRGLIEAIFRARSWTRASILPRRHRRGLIEAKMRGLDRMTTGLLPRRHRRGLIEANGPGYINRGINSPFLPRRHRRGLIEA